MTLVGIAYAIITVWVFGIGFIIPAIVGWGIGVILVHIMKKANK